MREGAKNHQSVEPPNIHSNNSINAIASPNQNWQKKQQHRTNTIVSPTIGQNFNTTGNISLTDNLLYTVKNNMPNNNLKFS